MINQENKVTDYLPIIISMLALMLSGIGYYSSITNQEIDNKIKIQNLIQSAWDDLGGEPGTEYIDKPVSPESVVLASRKIDDALSIEENNPDARIIRAIILYHKGLLHQRNDLILQAKELLYNVLIADAYFSNVGNIYYTKSLISTGMLKEAEDHLTSLIGINKTQSYKSFDILFTKAWLILSYLKNDFDKVHYYIKLLDSIDTNVSHGTSVDDERIAIEFTVAKSYLENDNETALEYYLRIIDKGSERAIVKDVLPHIHIMVAKIYGDLGKYDEAMKYFKVAIKLNHDLAKGWINIGEKFGRIAEDPEILKIFESEYKKNPHSVILSEDLGVSYLYLKKYINAISHYNECIINSSKESSIILPNGVPVSRRAGCYRKLAIGYMLADALDKAYNVIIEAINEGYTDRLTLDIKEEILRLKK